MAKIPEYVQPDKTPIFTRPSILKHGNIPKPLHGVNPRTIMGKDWWDIQRFKAYNENNNCCWACGVHRTEAKYHYWIEAHEIYKIDWAKGRAVYKGCCALCHSCHNFIHSGRLRMLADSGKIPQKKYRNIMAHGERLIGKGHITIPRKIQQDWTRWHLIIGDKRYQSPFRDEAHWRQHFGN